MRDDRVLPGTRVLAAVIVPFLVAAFLLYLDPAGTGSWFAWPVRPRMTPLIMGAGYLAGAYFFARVATARLWHRVHLGFLPITAFTVCEEVATIAHWDRFDHHAVAFWIWTCLYSTTPLLVPLAWMRNRSADPRTPESGEAPVPLRLRGALVVLGVVQSAVALVLLVTPATMIDVWPWALTPLTARVLAGWFALPGIVALMMGFDGRWSAIRITLQSQLIGLVLILAGVPRAWGDFDGGSPATYLVVGGLALLALVLAAFWVAMARLQARQHVSGEAGLLPV